MDTFTYQPAEADAVDTFLGQNAPTSNYGTNAQLQIGEGNNGTNYRARAIIKLDLSSIPAGNIQDSAVTSLWTLTASHDYADNAATVSVYQVLRTIVETEATWNKFSTAGGNWTTAGCAGVGTDRGSTVLATGSWAANLAANTKVQFTFAAHALEPFFGSSVYLIFQTDNELNDMMIFNSSSGTDSTKRPQTVIQHHVPDDIYPNVSVV
jgi:hypothetical protein